MQLKTISTVSDVANRRCVSILDTVTSSILPRVAGTYSQSFQCSIETPKVVIGSYWVALTPPPTLFTFEIRSPFFEQISDSFFPAPYLEAPKFVSLSYTHQNPMSGETKTVETTYPNVSSLIGLSPESTPISFTHEQDGFKLSFELTFSTRTFGYRSISILPEQVSVEVTGPGNRGVARKMFAVLGVDSGASESDVQMPVVAMPKVDLRDPSHSFFMGDELSVTESGSVTPADSGVATSDVSSRTFALGLEDASSSESTPFNASSTDECGSDQSTVASSSSSETSSDDESTVYDSSSEEDSGTSNFADKARNKIKTKKKRPLTKREIDSMTRRLSKATESQKAKGRDRYLESSPSPMLAGGFSSFHGKSANMREVAEKLKQVRADATFSSRPGSATSSSSTASVRTRKYRKGAYLKPTQSAGAKRTEKFDTPSDRPIIAGGGGTFNALSSGAIAQKAQAQIAANQVATDRSCPGSAATKTGVSRFKKAPSTPKPNWD